MLARVPGSVLWLLRFPPEAEALLRAEAARHSSGQLLTPEAADPSLTVEAEQQRLRAEAARHSSSSPSLAARIIFSDVAPKPLHLARLARLADVYLDTPACNAHTGPFGLMTAMVGGVSC